MEEDVIYYVKNTEGLYWEGTSNKFSNTGKPFNSYSSIKRSVTLATERYNEGKKYKRMRPPYLENTVVVSFKLIPIEEVELREVQFQ